MPPSEYEQLNRLFRLLREGKTDALDGVYTLVGRRMLALARGIVRNAADAEDVVQESFLKIARSVFSYRDGTNAYGWVMRITRNTALDFLRRNHRVATESLDEFFHLTDELYSPERREEALVLEEAICALPAVERRMIYYKYYLDFTVREIASETGMSKSAVQRLIAQAEKHLKNLSESGTNGQDKTL